MNRCQNFGREISRSRDLVGLAEKLRALMGHSLECYDLLRSAIVLAVSAVDKYMHDLLVDNLVQVFLGKRESSRGISSLRVPVNMTLEIHPGSNVYEREVVYRCKVSEVLSRITCQRADDIGDGLKLICDDPFWSTFYGKGTGAENMKRELNLIVTRRNKIVHESDVADPNLGDKWPIDADLVKSALNHME